MCSAMPVVKRNSRYWLDLAWAAGAPICPRYDTRSW